MWYQVENSQQRFFSKFLAGHFETFYLIFAISILTNVKLSQLVTCKYKCNQQLRTLKYKNICTKFVPFNRFFGSIEYSFRILFIIVFEIILTCFIIQFVISAITSTLWPSGLIRATRLNSRYVAIEQNSEYRAIGFQSNSRAI